MPTTVRRILANITLRMWWLLVPTGSSSIGPFLEEQSHAELVKDTFELVRPDKNWKL